MFSFNLQLSRARCIAALSYRSTTYLELEHNLFLKVYGLWRLLFERPLTCRNP